MAFIHRCTLLCTILCWCNAHRWPHPGGSCECCGKRDRIIDMKEVLAAFVKVRRDD